MLFLSALQKKTNKQHQQQHRAESSLDKKDHLSQLNIRTPHDTFKNKRSVNNWNTLLVAPHSPVSTRLPSVTHVNNTEGGEHEKCNRLSSRRRSWWKPQSVLKMSHIGYNIREDADSCQGLKWLQQVFSWDSVTCHSHATLVWISGSQLTFLVNQGSRNVSLRVLICNCSYKMLFGYLQICLNFSHRKAITVQVPGSCS